MSQYERNKKIIVLFDPRNPFWQKKHKISVDIAVYAGISRVTYGKWLSGELISPKAVERICSFIKENKSIVSDKYHNISQKLNEYIGNDACSAFEFASLFNISAMMCRLFIDEALQQRTPLFVGFCYGRNCKNTIDNMNEDYSWYRGVYYVFRIRNYKKVTFLTRSILQVRYPMKVRSRPDVIAIRIKMNVPLLIPKGKDQKLEYDGFLSLKALTAYWVLEQRVKNGHEDFLFLISKKKQARADSFLGFALTTFGFEEQVPISERALFIPIVDKSEDEQENILVNYPKIFAEADWISDPEINSYVQLLLNA